METDYKERRTMVLKGVGVSPGIVIGRAYLFDRLDNHISYYKFCEPGEVTKEVKRLRAAIKSSDTQLRELKDKLSHMGGKEPLYILDVHLLLLEDKSFVRQIVRFIRDMCVNAEWAVRMTLDRYRKIFEKVEDEYLRGRISDVQYVGQRILRNLAGEEKTSLPSVAEGVIIIATDLSPADTAQLKIDRVLGFATDIGGRTSHTAIVAQSIEIPAVVGLETITSKVQTNDELIIDGSAGLVIINPGPEVRRRYREKKKLYQEALQDSMKYATLPAVTLDERRIDIGGNIEFVEEIPSTISHGADGIGLYRTEFIYVNREHLPTEEDHFEIYRRVVENEGLNWATIRTFDLGGDKFFSDPKLAKEMNPQMGLRAIRLCLKEVDLFKVQLRAILRASAYGKTRIMFPMISGLEEIRETRRILNQAKEELITEGSAFGNDVEVGIMIEVPSAVVMADQLSKEVDFFSIGTNDLIQYALAIDRINERVTYLYEPLHPAVIRLVKQVVETGHHAGIRVAMCGEMAGDPLYTMILIGLELDELSMNPLAIPRVKKIIRAVTFEESKALAREALMFSSATEIRQHVESYMEKRFPEDFSSYGQQI
jgi:phosphotransferase system enzyme I (PtsI)